MKVYNYALSEYVANATVVLIEKKGDNGGGILVGNASCKEIAWAITDSNGECFFDKEKLKSNKKYDYFFTISNIYGQTQNYPCQGKNYLDKGKVQEIILDGSYYDGYLKVQYNNLLNPSQQDDSLNVRITSTYYNLPNEPYAFGGDGVFVAFPFYGCNGFPFPAILYVNSIKTQGGKKIVNIRKRKMGIVTTTIDTVKVYPNQTTIVPINW
ncbi:MAG: hypothetical protein ABIP51_06750 [Bacteroidia bacterium]